MVAPSTDRDDADVTMQGSFNLATHEVVWVVETPVAVIIRDTCPATADHDEHHVARRDGMADNFRESSPGSMESISLTLSSRLK
jgi:hypothetical protein